jgi:peptide-methionine (S)-S-oxide reductase
MRPLFLAFGLAVLGTALASLVATADEANDRSAQSQTPATEEANNMQLATATFGGGCFWCTEAVFVELKGVESVTSGYMGGQMENPTYKEVCTGLTGHAEVIQIKYDPQVVSFDVLLEVFWKTHDPTTLNRQGADVGTQYRSVVFYHTDEQRQLAESYKQKLNEAKAFNSPIVTEISAASKFYPAEDYHQDYYANNPNQGYCRAVIPPKLKKLRAVFGDKLKDADRK